MLVRTITCLASQSLQPVLANLVQAPNSDVAKSNSAVHQVEIRQDFFLLKLPHLIPIKLSGYTVVPCTVCTSLVPRLSKVDEEKQGALESLEMRLSVYK